MLALAVVVAIFLCFAMFPAAFFKAIKFCLVAVVYIFIFLKILEFLPDQHQVALNVAGPFVICVLLHYTVVCTIAVLRKLS